jgi:hypothetical protein
LGRYFNAHDADANSQHEQNELHGRLVVTLSVADLFSGTNKWRANRLLRSLLSLVVAGALLTTLSLGGLTIRLTNAASSVKAWAFSEI